MLFPAAAGQGTEVLDKMWEQDIIPATKEMVNVLAVDVPDLNNDGYADAYVITASSTSSLSPGQRNQINVYRADGTRVWGLAVDGRIRDAIIEDIDNDHNIEFVISTGEVLNKIQKGTIRIVDSVGNLQRRYESTAIMNRIRMGDLDGDRYNEIAGGSEKRLYLFQIYGENLWSFPSQGDRLLTAPVTAVDIADVDGDGKGEVIAGADMIYYIDPKGNLITSIDLEPETPVLNKEIKYLLEGKFTGTGYPDTLAVTSSDLIKTVTVKRARTRDNAVTDMVLEQGWTTKLECRINDIKLQNIDADNNDEILIACSDNKVYALDHTGYTLWEYQLDGEPRSLYIADVDQDGGKDILVASETGTLYALTLKGDFEWMYKVGHPLAKVGAGDMNGDGRNEIVVVTQQPKIMAFTLDENYTTRKKADGIFMKGQEAYLKSDYPKALEFFREAKLEYSRLGDQKGIYEVQTLISKIESLDTEAERKEGDLFYAKAQEYYYLGDMPNAKNFVAKANEAYTKFGNNEGMVKCELLRMLIEKRMSDVNPTVTPGNRTTTTVPEPDGGLGTMAYVVAAAILLLIVAVAVFGRKGPKKKKKLTDAFETGEEMWEQDMKDLEKEVRGALKKEEGSERK